LEDGPIYGLTPLALDCLAKVRSYAPFDAPVYL